MDSSTGVPSKQKQDNHANHRPTFNLKFVVATLPYPIHTHFALVFDRMAEVIEDGAQDEGYSYEASWLPWNDRQMSYVRIADDDEASARRDLRERQPGILLFRGASPDSSNPPSTAETGGKASLEPYAEGLIVFVAGEDPTRGIHREQFTNALAWITALKPLDSG